MPNTQLSELGLRRVPLNLNWAYAQFFYDSSHGLCFVVAKCTLLLVGAPDLLAGTAECLVCVKWLDNTIELYLALLEHQFS